MLNDIRGLLIIVIIMIAIAGIFEYNELNCDNLDNWYYVYNCDTHEMKQVHFEIEFTHKSKGEVTIENKKESDGITYTLIRVSKNLSVSYRNKILSTIQTFRSLRGEK